MREQFEFWRNNKANSLRPQVVKTWREVASDVINFCANRNLDKRPTPKIGWVSSWNSKCGIAEYSKSIVEGFSEIQDVIIYSDFKSKLVRPDEENVKRIWFDHTHSPIRTLINAFLDDKVRAVVIQFHFAFFSIRDVVLLVNKCKEHNIEVFITFHSIHNYINRIDEFKLAGLTEALSQVKRIFVHRLADLNVFHGMGLKNNTTLFSIGVSDLSISPNVNIKQEVYGVTHKALIGCYGFLMPHKGILELITVFSKIKKNLPNAELVLLNSLYDSAASKEYKARCLKRIADLKLEKSVVLIDEFLNENETLTLLHGLDLIILPYLHSQESSSAAVKTSLASKRPVLVSDSHIFDDVRSIVHTSTINDLAFSIEQLLKNADLLSKNQTEQDDWIMKHSWTSQAKKMENIILQECSHAGTPLTSSQI